MARKRNRQGAARLRERGHRAYLRGDYDEAIELWQHVGEQIKKMQPKRIFAEAYFRRGVERIHQKNEVWAGVEDLQRAREMYPKDLRFTYHLGLGLHLHGDQAGAHRIYVSLRKKESEFAARVTFPLALALLQQERSPEEHPVWADLTETERAMLRDVQTFRRRPYKLDDAAPPLWHGVVALDEGELDKATSLITEALDTSETADKTAFIHYYLGNAAGQREDWEAARQHWIEAESLGMKSPSLTLNLGESFHRLAEARLEADDAQGAIEAARKAARYRPDKPSLRELRAQAHHHLGYEAANQGDWSQAEEHWQRAYDLEDGSFRAAYNLALAYERHENYLQAGETWREVLRRRPRKDDHRDAISDEEVAQLWKRAAQAYVKAGEYDEAIHVYKMAVKWNPDNLETRMELVRGLLDNGQFRAAENELERILDRDPDYIPALIQMGEVLAAHARWWEQSAAPRYLQRALELEPNNLEAQQALIDYYLNQVEDRLRWGNVEQAYEMLQQALKYQPRNVDVLTLLGRCHVMVDEMDEVQACVDKILDRDQPSMRAYMACINLWLMAEEPDKVAQIMTQSEETLPNVPPEAYMAIGAYYVQDPRYTEEEGVELAQEWFEKATENSSPESMILFQIGDMLAMTTEQYDLAAEYLKRAIEADQKPSTAYISLALIAFRQGDEREARRYLRRAEDIARRDKNHEELDRIRMIRDMLTMPPDLLNLILNSPFGPYGPGGPFADEF